MTRILALLVALGGTAAVTAQEKPKKVALLIGVNKYLHRDLDSLYYAEADVDDLRAELTKSDYTVKTLSGKEATLARIRDELKALAERGKGADMALVALSGHGIQPEESKEAYFCPYDSGQKIVDRNGKKDAEWDLDGSMLPISEVLAYLKGSGAGAKALLVDACRKNAEIKPRIAKGGFATGYNVGDLPDNLAVLLSCSKSESSWEDNQLKHGVFFYHVLEGLRGKGAISGQVSAASLTAYVQQAVKADVPKYSAGRAKQTPHPIINGSVDFLIVVNSAADRNDAKTVSLNLGNNVKLDLVRIPAGSFTMGSPAGETGRYKDEGPTHKVTISQPFHMGKTEVTVRQFRQFVDDANYRTTSENAGDSSTWKKNDFSAGDDHPVVHVSHKDAVAFCAWLSKKTGQNVTLPTEAQWEYSCRAGTQSAFHFGNDESRLGDSAWFTGNTNDKGTRPVGGKKPNDFGLFDMHGNVWEWCLDGKREYKAREETDPVGPLTGATRVNRGGSFYYNARYCRAARRFDDDVSCRYFSLGFRVVVVR